MATVRDTIRGSLRLIGAIAYGETPSADEQSDGLSVLNEMLDSWATEGLTIYETVREEFTLTAGQSSRTLGDGGNFDTDRPVIIERAKVMVSGLERDIREINVDEWADITNKTQSGVPEVYFVAGSFPLQTLHFYPVPSASDTLVLYSKKPLSQLSNLSATLSLPPGYLQAIRFNLAVALAAEYGKSSPGEVVSIAAEAKANLKRMNHRPKFMVPDTGLPVPNRRFNILTGGYE